jgi:ABC-2 type transport system permease protein
MKALLVKILHEKRWSLLGWSFGMFAMTYFVIIFFPSLKESGSFEEFSKSLPAQFQSLLGDALAFTQFPNYVSSQIFDLRLPLIGIIFAVIIAMNLSVHEEESGTLKTLQSLPISRARVILAKLFAIFVMTAVVTFFAFPSTLLGAVSIGEQIEAGPLFLGVIMLWLFTLSMSSFCFMIGSALGKRGLAVGISSLFAVYNVLIAMMAPAITELQRLHTFTLYYYYNNPRVIVHDLDWVHVAVLIGATICSGLLALFFYHRRDIQSL